VPHLGADVDGDEHESGRPQHPMHLREGLGKLAWLEMDDCVKRDRCSELAVGGRQVEEVPLAELDRARRGRRLVTYRSGRPRLAP
jgi:hypothetical protein